jgi:hypothetical protein
MFRGARLLILIPLLLATGLMPSLAATEWGSSRPIPSAPLRPVLPTRTPYLNPTFGGGFLLPRGQSQYRMSLSHTNFLTFSAGVIDSSRPDPTIEDIYQYVQDVHATTGDGLFYFDGEVTRIELAWSRGMPGKWELGVEMPVIRYSGGMFDHTIEEFHEAFGFGTAGRDVAPENDVGFIFLHDDGKLELDPDDAGNFEPGDLMLSARFSLPMPGKRTSAEAGVFVELPTGETDVLAGSGSTDVALSFSMGWTFSRCRLSFGLGYALLGDLDGAPDIPINDSFSAGVTWEVRFTPRIWWITQYLHSQSSVHDTGVEDVSDAAELVAIGPRFEMGRNLYLDFVAIEDAFNHNSDLDIGLLFNLTWRR